MIHDLDADTLTLRRRPIVVEQYDGTPPAFAIVQGSPSISRRPRGDESLSVLLHVAMKTPEHFAPPQGMAFCGECGDWRPINYFTTNPSKRNGLDRECKGCQAERKREARRTAAILEGREVRRYYKQEAA